MALQEPPPDLRHTAIHRRLALRLAGTALMGGTFTQALA